MLFFFFQIGICFLWTFVSAALEVHIEGSHGWAKNLPTWRRDRCNGMLRIAQLVLMGGRPVTGYHFCMFTLQFIAFHLCYAQGLPITWRHEGMILAIFFLVCPTWDFLWFVLNPAYGMKKFTKEHVEWHVGRWWPFGAFPIDYAIGACLSVLFASAALWNNGESQNVIGLAAAYALWAWLIVITVGVIGPWYRRRRVELLAGNDPPAIETNVDDEEARMIEEMLQEEEKEDEALRESLEQDVSPPIDSSGNG